LKKVGERIMDKNQSHFIFMNPYKSVAGSIFLTLFLGPIGLLYATFWGAIVMLILALIAVSFASASVVFFWLVWFVCIYVGVIAVNRHNKKIYHDMLGVQDDSLEIMKNNDNAEETQTTAAK